MTKITSKINKLMQHIYLVWHAIWWNHHVSQARLHDKRIAKLAPYWRERR